MRSSLGHIVVAVVLAAAGSVCWLLGEAERQMTASREQLATLRYGDAADGSSSAASLESIRRLPVVGNSMAEDARDVRAAASYWLGQYDALKPARDAAGATADHDVRMLLVAANAAYRVAHASTADRATAIKELNEVIKGYGEALRGGGTVEAADADAAYNLEFVVRMRDQIARQRGTAGIAKPDEPAPASSIHGRQGAPPKGVSMSEFRVVIPKRSEERQESPDAGRGAIKQRKG